jgi:hypothetical protein
MMRKLLLFAFVLLLPSIAYAARTLVLLRPQAPAIELNFSANTVAGTGVAGSGACASVAACVTYTGGVTNSTDLRFNDASGASFDTFAVNTIRIRPGQGVLIEEQRINAFLNSASPATQTITLSTTGVSTGNFITWVNGGGSITTSAGTATCTGFGAASQGTINTINCTVTGTVVLTLSGSLNQVQFEAGNYPTSYIPTAGSAVTRAQDSLTLSGNVLNILPNKTSDFTAVVDLGIMPSYLSQSFACFLSSNGSPFTQMISQQSNGTGIRFCSTGGSNCGTAGVGSGTYAANQQKVGLSAIPGVARHAAIAGGTVGSNATTLAAANNGITLGNGCSGTQLLNSAIVRFRLWQPHITDAQLQYFTVH